ncbi:MAG: DUF134 domain-containing protein [Spirochaetales bacterium]|nr:DUF134 domain-containing protein [Spirochaetales bacterium]
MPKPKKERFVRVPPPVVLFRPIGIPSSQLCQVVLLLDEYEALRLVDHEGMDQSRAAAELGISRATCARILESAHRKIAGAVVNGCAIKIEGGSYRFSRNRLRCLDCGNIWETGFDEIRAALQCPTCGNPNVIDLAERAGQRGGPYRGGMGPRTGPRVDRPPGPGGRHGGWER